MNKRSTLRLAAVAVMLTPTAALATWSMLLPTSEDDYYSNAEIEVDGSGEVSTDIIIKLKNNGVLGATESMTTTSEGDFNHEFTAPSGGWAISNSWAVYLYKAPDTKNRIMDPRAYNIVDVP